MSYLIWKVIFNTLTPFLPTTKYLVVTKISVVRCALDEISRVSFHFRTRDISSVVIDFWIKVNFRYIYIYIQTRYLVLGSERVKRCMNTTKWNFVRSWTSVFSYRNFGLSKSRRNIEVLRYQYMPEVVLVLHAPYRQPINVVHRQVARQNDFDVFPLITLQWCQTVETKIFAPFSLILIRKRYS